MALIAAQAQQTKWIRSGKADIEATLRGIYAASKERAVCIIAPSVPQRTSRKTVRLEKEV